MRFWRKNLLAIAPLLFAVILFNPHPALSVPSVNIQPAVSTPTQGSSFDLYVNISEVTDLYAFQFDIGFDPTILFAANVAEGTFLPAGGSTLFFPGIIDNTAGSISFIGDSLIGSIPGVSGDGTLAVLTFSALILGQSTIALSNVILLDSNFVDISIPTIDGSVTVSPANGTPVPEPATLFLMSIGMATIGILRKKGREII